MRRWTLERNGITITEIDCELPNGERLDVVEAASIGAELRERARSYFRDAQELSKLPGESLAASAYRTISDELHKTADALRLDLADAPAREAGDL